jgi:anaerobic selenocysteine-containing dehydrogenase
VQWIKCLLPALLKRWKTLVAHINTAIYPDRRFPDIRFIWWAGGASTTHHPGRNRLIRAWQKPELVVILTRCFWTAAAEIRGYRSACITASFERNSLTMTTVITVISIWCR